jgi:hypothetical protein
VGFTGFDRKEGILSIVDYINDGRRFCYFIDVGSYVPGRGYRPSIVVEGVAGQFPVGEDVDAWYWGRTYAEACEICRVKNERLGISESEAFQIVASSLSKAAEKV